MKKRGIFFSIDALIAVMIILVIVLIVYPQLKVSKTESNLPADILKTLSAVKVKEINNAEVLTWISQDVVDGEMYLIDQIGILALINLSVAQNLTKIALADLHTSENIGIWYDNNLIFSTNDASYQSANNIYTERYVISGIGGPGGTGSATGFSARGFLSSSLRTGYYYFGGYVGDGNITARVEYYGNLSSAQMELAANKNFSLYINGISSGTYAPSGSDFVPATYSLNNYVSNFQSGVNNLELRGEGLHVAGGFIKINYISEVNYTKQKKYYFPGISGLINLYDGLTIPGQLTNMLINLHFNSSQTLFVTIGNTTVYNGTSNGAITTVSLSNSQLSSLLNYNSLSNKTNPLRVGLAETVNVGNADIVIVTAASQSMNYSLGQDGVTGVRRNCDDPLLNDSTTARISLAQCLDKQFIDTILSIPGNRVSLVGYFGDELVGTGPKRAWVNRTDFLSNDSQKLKSYIDSYTQNIPLDEVNYMLPHGGACISCSINSAHKILKDYSDLTRKQFVIVMSDGVPTHKSISAGSSSDGRRTGYPQNDAGLPISTSCDSTTGFNVCTTNACELARKNANWSSCRVAGKTGIEGYNAGLDYGTNATVYSIGFGPVDQCAMAQGTLQDIANCGGGSYYESSDASQLQQIYQTIAQNIISIGYIQQTVTISQGNIHTTLYPDSYIEVNYSEPEPPFGLIIGTEKKFSDASSGTFFIPSDSQLLETRVASYSGPRWTDTVQINNQTAYKLSNYGSSYVLFGDPYSINIPENLVSLIQNNTITLTTAVDPANTTVGSAENKIIYTIVKNFSSFSPIASSANGCIWTIGFEDGTNLTTTIPASYGGSNICTYQQGAPQTCSTPACNPNDAFQFAVFNLLKALDFDNDGLIDVQLTSQSLQIDVSQITGIPYTWKTEVQVRVWS